MNANLTYRKINSRLLSKGLEIYGCMIRSVTLGGSNGIAPTILELDSWSPGVGFIPIIFTKGIHLLKKEIL